MGEIGALAVAMAFAVSVYGTLMPLVGVRLGRPEVVASGLRAVYANALLLGVAAAAFLHALLTRDFGNAYVASYSSRDLGFWYTLSAFWAGQAGSLLFWAVVLAGFSALAVWRLAHLRPLLPYAAATLMGTSAFFTLLLAVVSSPFARLPVARPDGAGLNPLLQNPGMFFHPPTQYLGFVGTAVPFAFAVAALATRRLDDGWIRATRRWTLAAWFFLSWGLIFGMMWAYVELGWGGFWAWDPVENAALMPWLTATAFLHSVMIQEKRGLLKVWNLVLIILTFALAVFGTFLTRSGVLSSVHAFATSSLGPLFFAFILIILGIGFGLLFSRLDALGGGGQLDSLISRESGFLFNNLIFVGAAFAVFIGTVFPVLSEAVTGLKISVGPPFFNQINVPIGLALLLLMGACPLLAWRKASPRSLLRAFTVPGALAATTAAVLLIVGLRHPAALGAFSLCVFVAAAVLQDVHRGAKVRRGHGEPYAVAVGRMAGRNPRRYGGYVIHLGIVLLFAGMAGSALSTERDVVLSRGETVRVGRYTLRYDGGRSYLQGDRLVTEAALTVFQGGRRIAAMRPQRNVHTRRDEQVMTEVAIRTTAREDLYVILSGLGDDGRANIRVIINPLMLWMWIGAGVLTLGTALAAWPHTVPAVQARTHLAAEAA